MVQAVKYFLMLTPVALIVIGYIAWMNKNIPGARTTFYVVCAAVITVGVSGIGLVDRHPNMLFISVLMQMLCFLMFLKAIDEFYGWHSPTWLYSLGFVLYVIILVSENYIFGGSGFYSGFSLSMMILVMTTPLLIKFIKQEVLAATLPSKASILLIFLIVCMLALGLYRAYDMLYHGAHDDAAYRGMRIVFYGIFGFILTSMCFVMAFNFVRVDMESINNEFKGKNLKNDRQGFKD